MRRAWLVLLAAVLLPVASAHAAQPIEGQWLAGQSVVEFRATGAGAYAGVVRVGTFPRCGDPGAVVVPQLTGTGGNYAGTLRWSGPGCQDAFDAPATLTVTGPLGGAPTGGAGDVASLCAPAAPGGPAGCLFLQRAPSMPCTDGIDNDLDGAVDGADPACLVLTGASPQTLAESADPQLTVTTTTGGVLEGRAGDRTRVAFQVRVTPPVARDVHVTTTLVTSGADAATDLAVAGGIGRVTLAPRQPAAEVAIDVLGDDLYEGGALERFGVALSEPDGAGIAVGSALVSIFDDDPPGAPALRPPATTVRPPATTTRPPSRPSAPGRADPAAACPLDAAADLARTADCPVLPKPVNLARRTRSGSAGVDHLVGTPQPDQLLGLGGNDRLVGLGRSDRLNGGRGNDELLGGAGNDELDGHDGDDRLVGGPGNDLLVETRFGDDVLIGGPGNDLLRGDHGDDRISAGPGDDIVIGGSGKDTVDCGPGRDVLYYNLVADRSRSRNCERFFVEEDIAQVACPRQGTARGELVLGGGGADVCHGNGGDDDVEGGGGSDRLFGGAGNDTMFGRFGRDVMDGGPGNDLLEGGRDADTLRGGPGRDRLVGGYGRDRLYGGAGNDVLDPGWGERGEVADCGPGTDTLVAGPGDRGIHCERRRRP